MATTNIKNYNVTPYYDDFDESKGFHRILFKPGVSVQARELTQLQTLLQAQLDRKELYESLRNCKRCMWHWILDS